MLADRVRVGAQQMSYVGYNLTLIDEYNLPLSTYNAIEDFYIYINGSKVFWTGDEMSFEEVRTLRIPNWEFYNSGGVAMLVIIDHIGNAWYGDTDIRILKNSEIYFKFIY